MAEIEQPVDVTINATTEIQPNREQIEENRIQTTENKASKPKRTASEKQRQALQKAREAKKINQKVNKIVQSSSTEVARIQSNDMFGSSATYILPIMAVLGVGSCWFLKKSSAVNMNNLNEKQEVYSRLALSF